MPRALRVRVVGAIYRLWQPNLNVVEPCGRRRLLARIRYIRGPINYISSRLFRISHRRALIPAFGYPNARSSILGGRER